MLTYFRRGSGHENEHGTDTVGSGISPNAFLVSEQRSMPEYGYGFSYNLPLNGSAIFRRRSSYEIGHGTGTFGSGIKFNHVLVPVHSSEYGYGCGTRTLLTPSIFRIGTGTFGSGTNFNHVSVPVNRSEYGYRCGISFNYVSVPVHISEYGYGLFFNCLLFCFYLCICIFRFSRPTRCARYTSLLNKFIWLSCTILIMSLFQYTVLNTDTDAAFPLIMSQFQ